mmetsp:Transcript_7578/g.22703  ORF Transcript_7578/g.22703 Transcript_7578/m.22703 type:complete len:216 (-) Transcript_7578:93-740(-)
MPLATLKVLGGTFKLNALACSRACYARACICSESILLLLLLLLSSLLLLCLFHYLTWRSRRPPSPSPLQNTKKNSVWLKRSPRQTRDACAPVISSQSRLFAPRTRETFVQTLSFDFVRRFHSFLRFLRFLRHPRPRRLVHQLILLIKYSFSSSYSSSSRVNTFPASFLVKRSTVDVAIPRIRVVSRPFSTPTSNSFFLLGLVHSSKKKKKKKGNC